MGQPIQRRRPWWMSFLNRTNLVVTGLTASVVILTRSAGVAYLAIGALMCTITVKLLKKAIRQPRPLNQTTKHKTSYGMPSTHSATISYYAAYIPLACIYLPFHKSFPQSVWTRVLPPLVFLPYAGTVVLSRVWLGHHTLPQIMAGVSYGLIFAVVWFKMWGAGVNKYGSQLEDFVDEWVI